MGLTSLIRKVEHKPFQLERIEEELELFGYNLLHRNEDEAKSRLEEIKRQLGDLGKQANRKYIEGIALALFGAIILFEPEINEYLKTDINILNYYHIFFRVAGSMGVVSGLLEVFGNKWYRRIGQNRLDEAQSRLDKILVSPESNYKIH